MECGVKAWIVRGWDSYTAQRDLRVSLGDISNDNHVNGTHSAIKAAKRATSNSFLIQFKREARTKWKLTLELHTEVKNGNSYPDNSGRWEL